MSIPQYTIRIEDPAHQEIVESAAWGEMTGGTPYVPEGLLGYDGLSAEEQAVVDQYCRRIVSTAGSECRIVEQMYLSRTS